MTAPGDGGRYVVVTSGCLSGHGGKDKRLKVLRAEASADEIPTERTEVYTAGNAPTQDHRLALFPACCFSIVHGRIQFAVEFASGESH